MEIQKLDISEKTYLGRSANIKISEIMHNPIFADVYQAVGKYCQENQVQVVGPAVAIYKNWDQENDATTLMPAFTVAPDSAPGDFELFTAPSGQAYVTIHKGPYSNLGETHAQIKKYLEEDGTTSKLVIEEYVVYPDEGVKEEDYQTKITYYI